MCAKKLISSCCNIIVWDYLLSKVLGKYPKLEKNYGLFLGDRRRSGVCATGGQAM
jgi:hypothetical protein